jgi:hypothetical protein
VPLVPAGRPVREMVREVFTSRTPPSAADLAAGVIARQADAVASAAEGCDVLVAGGLTTAAAGAQAVSEKRGVRYMYAAYAPCYLPSPCYPPLSLHGQPAPPDVTDSRVLWDLHARGMNAVFGAPVNAYRASLGLPAVDNVRDYVSPTTPCWGGRRGGPGPWPPGPARGRLGRPRPDRRPGRLPRCRGGQPAGTVPPGGRRGAPRRRGHDHDGPVPTAGSLSAALGTALAPETVARAAAVAGVIRTDEATVAAKLLLEAVAG